MLKVIDQNISMMVRTIGFHQGVMTMAINWLWLVAGLIPCYIKRQKTKDEQILTVKALFWRFTIRWKEEQCSWELSIPFIEHSRQ